MSKLQGDIFKCPKITTLYDKEKQQNLSSEKLEPENVWIFFTTFGWKIMKIINWLLK